ncbi:MAG: hypothetical protein K2P53_06040 [Rickettsiales bacterium]|nr:hypothetical protein [Burkholderiales bacterium]MBY0581221.1 hypothetical protein [Rickettsiales bacterium]
MIIKQENQEELSARQKKIIFSIKKQFDIFQKKGISVEHIETICRLSDQEKRNLGLLRIQIIDDRLYVDHHVASIYPESSKLACNNIIKRLVRIVKTHKIHNIDFIFLTIDNINNIAQESGVLIENFPAFMSSKNLESKLEKNKLLLPDPYILDNEKWPNLINQINEASKTYSWDEKIEKIFWRGATTGGTYNLENYHKLCRLTLVMLSRSFPDLIDAKFVDYANFSNNQSGIYLYNIMIRLFDNPGKLTETEHLKYKYLISIDGNTAAWLRVPWILLSNSILLKPETSFTQIFYDALEPYVNYIPLKEDLSDVFEKLEWLKTNDSKAEIISKNATAFCQKALMPNDFDNYIATTLNEYHLLQKFRLKDPTLPPISSDFSF